MNNDVDAGDRLSSLSDDLIHKIFSSISTKLVVQTSAFSSRWRFIWTSIPYLNLSTQDFPTSSKFSEFVRHVLSHRNTEIEVSSVKLNLGQKVSQGFVKEIRDYAFSRNIQQLDLSLDSIADSGSEFPLSLLSFPSLKYLSLSIHYSCRRPMCTTSSFELSALTTLYLHNVELRDDDNDGLFSKCANLKNLALKRCRIVNSGNFSICHPRLSNLTLDNSFVRQSVNVVAPKLENLTIRHWFCDVKEYFIKISAPDLTSFVYKGYYSSLRLSTNGFNSLKEADICVSEPTYGQTHHILPLLQHLRNVKFLTLNMEILEYLSLRVELMLRQPVGFVNLKRLKIFPQSVSSQGQAAPDNSYYLYTSPGAKLEVIVAQSIVLEFSMLLEQEKTKTHMERGKGPMESHGTKMPGQGKSQAETKLKIGESVTAKIDRCLGRLREQIDQNKSRYHLIISKLQKIQEFLAKLPASKTSLIQPSFASLYAEAVVVMGGITDLMKTQCDENESQISGCIQELATAWKPSY